MRSHYFNIGSRPIGSVHPPFVIAEIGVNHEGSLERALRMIGSAATAGASAVKFQAYKADRLAAADSPAYWDLSKEPTTSQRELFRKFDRFGADEFRALAECASEAGIAFMATPFDLEAVELLEPLMPAYKIASADITNVPLLRAVAAKGKPVLLSTGAADEAEIAAAVAELEGAPALALLHCVLEYPTPTEDAQLQWIRRLAELFPDAAPGYSDHTVPDEAMSVLFAAWLAGACVIEKHYTDDKTATGNDHYHAMNARDLERFTARVAETRVLLGNRHEREPLPGEAPARRHARRSLVAARDLAAGERLTERNLTWKRPGHGIPASAWDAVRGRTVAGPVAADTVLTWDMLAD